MTVRTPPMLLRQELQEGEIERSRRHRCDRGKTWLFEIFRVHRDAEHVRALYENRLDDLSLIPGEQPVVEIGDTFVIQTVQDRRGASIS